MIYKIMCTFDKINSIILSFVIFIISPILFILICCVWLFWGADESLIYNYITKSKANFNDYTIFGAWGDTFGAFNALLTALGFIGIVITIILQYISFKTDKKNTNKQNIESLIFKQISMINELRKEITFSFPTNDPDLNKSITSFIAKQKKDDIIVEYSVFGKKIFKICVNPISLLYREKKYFFGETLIITSKRKNNISISQGKEALRFLEHYISVKINQKEKKKEKLDVQAMVSIYIDAFHKNNEYKNGAYFRTLYYILEKIMNEKYLSSREKEEYGNLIRGQMSSPECSIIAINALAPFSKDLYDIVIYFRLLKYVTNPHIKRRLELFYPKKAFSERKSIRNFFLKKYIAKKKLSTIKNRKKWRVRKTPWF